LQAAILGASFFPVQERLPDAPPSWQAFFAATFAAEEQRRASTVAEFWQGLQDCLRKPD